ncbi:hypothetical protein MNBD_GAMMA04-291 [hydrothermal vent metagenome]|uniref:DUF4276 family protein n=1 Tax=hydrothermal vent metagenome TaxID=652676 RepID=A0A3B0W124_9ZZZZ
MANSKKILLVEGETDRSFFEEMCKKLSLNTLVQVALPRDLGGGYNSKEGVLNHLNVLLPQLEDGQLLNIAVVIDADYIEHGSGGKKTLEKVTDILKSFDFALSGSASSSEGLLFNHSDGLADFGLWVMPNNDGEGMLEDWIKTCIKNDEKALFQQATTTVKQLSSPKFKPHLKSKAEIATWLAWQKKPGCGLYSVMKEGLLDENSVPYKKLAHWLKSVFKDV